MTATPQRWEFGRVESVDDLPDFTPVEFHLYGYDRETKQEHDFEFHALSTQPFGSTLDVMRQQNDQGEVPANVAIAFLYDCLIPSERARWDEVVHKGELYFKIEALVEMAQTLLAYYGEGEANRPTSPPSGSPDGRLPAGPTSTVVHNGRVSTSVPSTQPTPLM
jgi:hypothetical protein